MNLRRLLLIFCLSFVGLGYADANHHFYPHQEQAASSMKPPQYPGYCEIEIINQSYDDIHVSGIFDDGVGLWPFEIYAYEYPHYISLYYYGYCHSGMEIDIHSINTGRHLFGGYVRRNSTVRVVSYLEKQAKVEVHPKS